MDEIAIERFLSLPEEQRKIHNSNCTYRLEGRVPIALPTIQRSWGKRVSIESPVSMFSSYGRTNLNNTPPGPYRFAVKYLSPVLTLGLQAMRVDRCVLAPSLPFATVLHYHSSAEALVADVVRVGEVTKRPVAVRGLNSLQHQQELRLLSERGFFLIPRAGTNVVVDPAKAAKKHQNARRDLRLIQRYPELEVTRVNEITAQEAQTVASFYRRLYIEKYSRENPDFSAEFIRSSINSGLQAAFLLRHATEGLVGFTTYYTNATSLAQPMIGYAMDLRTDYPLYRILMMEIFSEALRSKKSLLWGAGADRFKAQRGGVRYTDYFCILPRTHGDRLAFKAIRKMMEVIVAPGLA